MPEFKLRNIERERGELDRVIPALLEKHEGMQWKVANELGVTQATISNWLKANGYKRTVRWIKESA